MNSIHQAFCTVAESRKRRNTFSQVEVVSKVPVLWSMKRTIQFNFMKPRESISAEKHHHEIDKILQELQGLDPTLLSRKGSVLHDNG